MVGKNPLKNISKNRMFVMIAAGTAIAALLLLALGMDTLIFEPARPLVMPNQTGGAPRIQEMETGSEWPLIIFAAAVLLIALFFAIRDPEYRRQLIRFLGKLLLYALLFMVFFLYAIRKPEEVEPTPEPVPVTPIPVEPEFLFDSNQEFGEVESVPVPETNWVNYVTGILVLAILGGTGYLMWRITQPPEEPFREIALDALNDLAAGRAWDDTVIQCYARMSRLVWTYRTIHRNEDMTPREFVQRLENAGLPREPVRRLTELFERARYGQGGSGERDTKEAVSCLNAILRKVETT